MVKGIIAKFLGKLWNESQSSTTVSIRLDVWVKEKDSAFLTALQFMNTGISNGMDMCWWMKCTTSSFGVHHNTRCSLGKSFYYETMQEWRSTEPTCDHSLKPTGDTTLPWFARFRSKPQSRTMSGCGVKMGVDLKSCPIKISDQQWQLASVTEKPLWCTRTSEID